MTFDSRAESGSRPSKKGPPATLGVPAFNLKGLAARGRCSVVVAGLEAPSSTPSILGPRSNRIILVSVPGHPWTPLRARFRDASVPKGDGPATTPAWFTSGTTRLVNRSSWRSSAVPPASRSSHTPDAFDTRGYQPRACSPASRRRFVRIASPVPSGSQGCCLLTSLPTMGYGGDTTPRSP